MILDYMINNQLYVDRSTYLTVVIGQITMYGIVLTFYQFLATIRKADTSENYLGVNVPEYYMKKSLGVWNRLISNSFFLILFILEILYKPIMNVFGKLIPDEFVPVLNFWWYAFSIFFFIIFTFLIVLCAKSTLNIKYIFDVKKNKKVKQKLEKDFFKKTYIEKLKKSIDLLENDVDELSKAVEKDSNIEMQADYNRLLRVILERYINQKTREINSIGIKKYIPRNQRGWRNTVSRECDLLREIIENRYIFLDEKTFRYLISFSLYLIELNIKRAEQDRIEKISFFSSAGNFDIIDGEKLKKVVILLYMKVERNLKRNLINNICQGYNSQNKMFIEFCDSCIRTLIRDNGYRVFQRELSQEDYYIIFQDAILYNKELNEIYANDLCDLLTSHNSFICVEMLKLLKAENNNFVFAYLILYYSIYRFRFDWIYINIPVLKGLYEKSKNFKEVAVDTIEKLKKKSTMHRLTEKMLNSLIEGLQEKVTGKLFGKIYSDDVVDAFYMAIVRLCVLQYRYELYVQYIDIEQKIFFINEVSKHKELLGEKNVIDMIIRMQYDFSELISFPLKLNISLRNLLLTNIDVKLLQDRNIMMFSNEIGQYMLVIIDNIDKKNDAIKRIIKKAYVSKNMSIDDYIDYLEQECEICGKQLYYAQKQKMKKYLIELGEEHDGL